MASRQSLDWPLPTTGQTMDRIVLVLNDRAGQVGALPHGITKSSFYVGVSRVREGRFLAKLSMSAQDIRLLVSKGHSAAYRQWHCGYDQQCRWRWRSEVATLAMQFLAKFDTFTVDQYLPAGSFRSVNVTNDMLKIICCSLGLRRYSNRNKRDLMAMLSDSYSTAMRGRDRYRTDFGWRSVYRRIRTALGRRD